MRCLSCYSSMEKTNELKQVTVFWRRLKKNTVNVRKEERKNELMGEWVSELMNES